MIDDIFNITYFPAYKKKLDNHDNIVFYGRLSHIETLEYIKKANYSCFFRENDRVSNAGFPTKFAEAITCGTPVITNSTSDLKQYFKLERNGYLINGVKSDIIARVISDAKSTLETNNSLFDYHGFVSKINELFS